MAVDDPSPLSVDRAYSFESKSTSRCERENLPSSVILSKKIFAMSLYDSAYSKYGAEHIAAMTDSTMSDEKTLCDARRVLLLDDESRLSRGIAEGLRQHNYDVVMATNHENASALAARFKPPHCVLNLNPSGDYRPHLISALTSIAPGMRIVVVTSYGSVVTAVASMKNGAKDYLVTPFRLSNLLESLQGDTSPIGGMVDVSSSQPALRRVEWEYIQRTLHECHENISETARRLSMHRRTLQRKLNKRPVPERCLNSRR